MTRQKLWFFGILFVLGAGWGATQPMAKIAVEAGYRNFGIIVWQMIIGAIILGGFRALQGRNFRLTRPQFLFAIYIALIGTILPNGTGYQAAIHLPSGFLSIVIAAVPMVALPLALVLRIERFSWGRFAGLAIGLGGVAILASPDSLPAPGLAIWVLIALIAPSLYAIEGLTVAKLGTFGLNAIGLLFWASFIGIFIAVPLAVLNGSFFWPPALSEWGAPELSILAMSIIHAIVYASYVWLVGRAGPVFAGQVAYLVTGFGVLWAMLWLGETYPGTVWIALALVLGGLVLVQPRDEVASSD